MDDMTTRQVEWDELDKTFPSEYDKYWELTLGFLKFIRKNWPPILEELGHIEPAERRDRLIKAKTARLKQHSGPVIAAGSTGSIPATATLLETIARLPHGAVVLPGLDTDLDETTWATLADGSDAAHGHPQFALAALINRIGIVRTDVKPLAQAKPHGRERIVSEALRPAASSELWKDRLADAAFSAQADAAIDSVDVIEAANAEEEALAIAVALREAVEAPGKTAALATPGVGLGRRVSALMERWKVPVDEFAWALAGRYAGWRLRAARARGRRRRRRAGTAAGAAQAFLKPVRCGGRPGAGTRDLTRSAAAARHRGACPCADDIAR